MTWNLISDTLQSNKILFAFNRLGCLPHLQNPREDLDIKYTITRRELFALKGILVVDLLSIAIL